MLPLPLSCQALQVNDHVANRLRAAHKKVAVGGLVEWLRFINDCSGHETTLAVVTDTSPAGPADRDVATSASSNRLR